MPRIGGTGFSIGFFKAAETVFAARGGTFVPLLGVDLLGQTSAWFVLADTVRGGR
jgi:hypothetical protein